MVQYVVTCGHRPKQGCRKVWCLLSEEVTKSPLKLMMAFLTLRSIAGSLSMVWFTVRTFPFACYEVQVRGEFDLYLLKTEVRFPTPLRRAGGSHAEHTHFSTRHRFFRMLLPAQVPLPLGAGGQRLPASLHAAHGCEMRRQGAPFHLPLKLLPLPWLFPVLIPNGS